MTPAKILFHTCGSVAHLMDEFVDMKVDILNPIQVSAAGMNPVELNKKYGGQIVFWGAMDTQKVLPHGSVQDVKRMVEERIEQLGEGGGLCIVRGAQHPTRCAHGQRGGHVRARQGICAVIYEGVAASRRPK